MIDKILKAVAPVAAIGLATALSGCNADVNIGGEKGVPLDQLDLTGDAPKHVILAGPDKVIVTSGKTFRISVDGDDEIVDRLRFTHADGELGVLRESGDWSDWSSKDGYATVNVTLPRLEAVTIAGSGSVEAASLTGDAEINLVGSGNAKISKVSADKMELTVAASGNLEAVGTAKELKISIAGSGQANMPELSTDEAEVSIMGSGSASFASDGEVSASIMGSGNVRVIGRAKCEVNSMGSGSVVCEPAQPDKAAAKSSTKKKAAKAKTAPQKKAAKKTPAKRKAAKKKGGKSKGKNA